MLTNITSIFTLIVSCDGVSCWYHFLHWFCVFHKMTLLQYRIISCPGSTVSLPVWGHKYSNEEKYLCLCLRVLLLLSDTGVPPSISVIFAWCMFKTFLCFTWYIWNLHAYSRYFPGWWRGWCSSVLHDYATNEF